MNIIIVEERPDGERSTERSFNKSLIVVGRDATSCDIAFDESRYRMVSRRHAEIREQNGKWFVADLNSTYGTFLADGKRIDGQRALSVGDKIRFGTDGPVIQIVRFELGQENPKSALDHADVARPPTPRGMLAREGTGQPAIPLTKEHTWLGRDAESDIVFDSPAVTVSRKHAFVSFEAGRGAVTDNNSFNGTFVNERRISGQAELSDGDRIQLGLGGPILSFTTPSNELQTADELTRLPEDRSSETLVFKLDPKADRGRVGRNAPRLTSTTTFGTRSELIVGRSESCDIRLDGLQISKRHARLFKGGSDFFIEDLGSTNGVYVRGERVSRRQIHAGDVIIVEPFEITIDEKGKVATFDTRARTRVDAVDLSSHVKGRAAGKIALLDSVSLSVQPNEFVGIIGPSGSGKTTLIEALNGVRPPDVGKVFVNDRDLYRNFASLRQSLGCVPQEDIIHRELSVHRILFYVAKLRLARDTTSAEIEQIIAEVLDVTGLSGHRDVPVRQLSGGQRKRVSTAVELITKPAVIFLDEPTSGLDPAGDRNMMRLFREIASSGRTVIMTTHAMSNIDLFDKVALMMGGKLIFFGTPEETLRRFKVEDFDRLFEVLSTQRDAEPGGEIKVAERLRSEFIDSPEFAQHIGERLKELTRNDGTGKNKKSRLGIVGSVRQWFLLCRRYVEVLAKDRSNLFVLFAQAPLIALLTYLVIEPDRPRDFVYFVIALVAFWFGISAAARELVRERRIYRRERMFNLGIVPYMMSKVAVLALVVAAQCALLFIPLKIVDLAGLMSMPGEFVGVPQFWIMLLTGAVGIAAGLLISALARTSEVATSIVPLILIPQILFSGIIGVPHGFNRVAGMAAPSAWSFDGMKRFSTLDTLEPEGADPKGISKGLGLYESIKRDNETAVQRGQLELEELIKKAAGGLDPGEVERMDTPQIPDARSLPADLSAYVTFLHPWMNEVLNQVVLMLMFGMIAAAALIVMRIRNQFLR